MLRHPQKHLQKQWRKLHRTLSKKGIGILPFLSIITLISGFFLWYTHNRVVRDRAEASSPATTIQFLNNNLQAAETQTNPVIPIVLNGVATQDISIDYTIIGGTATQSVDYILDTVGTFTIPAGERGIGLPLKLVDDKQPDNNETIQIELSNPTGGVTLGGNTILQFVITDSKNLYSDPYFGLKQEVDTLPVIDNPIPSSLPDFATTSSSTLPDLSVTDPTSLSINDGLKLHLEADSLTEADGANLQMWNDLSGEGNDFTLSTSGEQPQLIHNAYNNRKAVRFDGVDDHLQLSNTDLLSNAAEFEVIVVEAPNDVTTTNPQTIFNVSQAGQDYNSAPGLLFERRSGNSIFGYSQPQFSTSSSSSLQQTTSNTLNQPAINILSRTSSTLSLSQNGVLYQSVAETDSFAQSQKIRLGRYKETSYQSYNGDILEILVFNRSLSTEELDQINCYLAQKYSVIVSGCGNPLQLHLDASTISGNDGDLVENWTDSSGNAYVATQSDPAFQPNLRTNALNGQNYLEYDRDTSAQDYLKISDAPLFQGNQMTNFIVSKHELSGQGILLNAVETGGSQSNQAFYWDKRSSQGAGYSSSSSYASPSATLSNTWVHDLDFDIMTLRKDSTQHELFLRGYLADENNLSSEQNFYKNHDVYVGGYVVPGTSAMQGGIAELISYNRALNDDEIEQVECYLANKYDLLRDGCNTPLKLHLDADQLTGSDGSAVSLWNDSTGNGLDAIQSETDDQPTLIHNAVNGKKAIRFDGQDDHLQLPEFQDDSNSTFITVAKRDSANGRYIFSDYGDSSNERMYYYVDTSNRLRSFYSDKDNQFMSNISVGSNDEYFISGGIVNGQDVSLFLNNEQVNSTQTSFDFAVNYDGTLGSPTIGAQVSQTNSLTNFWEGDIAEIIYYDRPLTESEFKEVRCYLADKYGVGEINTCGNALVLNLDANTLTETDNSPVASWSDGSSNSLNATQGDGAKQPLLIENAINGNKALRFDGVDDYLELPEFLGSKDTTVYVVGTKNDDAGYLFSDKDDVNDYLVTRFFANKYYGNVRNSIVDEAGSTVNSYTDGEQFISRLNIRGGEADIRFNKEIVDLTGSSTIGSSNLPPTIGGEDGAGPSVAFDGDIAQVLIFDGSLNDKQKNEIECYLSRRYAIENNSCIQDTIDFYIDAIQVSSNDVTNEKIDVWRDVSGEGKNFESNNTTSTPSYNNDPLHPSIVFDGDDILTNVADDIMFDSGNYSVFATIKPSTGAGRIHDFSNSTIGRYRTNFTTNNITYIGTSSTAYTVNIGSVANTSWSIAHLIKNNTISGSDFIVNGQNYFGVSGSSLGGQKNNALIGDDLVGDYYNSILFNKTLTESEARIVQTTLAARAGSTELIDYKYADEYPRVVGTNNIIKETNADEVLNISITSEEEGTVFAGYSPIEIVSLTDENISGGVVRRWNNSFALDKTGDADGTLVFDFEKYLGGNPVGSNYELLYRSNNLEDFTPVTLQNTTINGSRIELEVANNDLQDGYYTIGTTNEGSSPLSLILIPDPINDLTTSLNAAYGEVDLSFSTPNTNGSTITDYIIEYSADNFSTTLIYNDGVSTNTSYTLTDMLNGPEYEFRVRAITSTGEQSDQSNVDSVTFAPRVDSISPNSGVPEGGQLVTISGDNLDKGNGIPITINNTGNPELLNYVASFAVDTKGLYAAGDIDADCGNFTLLDNGGTLPLWVDDNSCNTTGTIMYTKLNIAADEQKELVLSFLELGRNEQDPEVIFEFYDGFNGTNLDTGKYDISNPNNFMTQDNKIIIEKITTGWNNPTLYTNQTFARSDIEFITEYTHTCDYTDNIFIGWQYANQSSYSQMPYAHYYYNNGTTSIREKNSNRLNGTYSCNQKYYLKIAMKEAGGATYYRSLDGVVWDLLYDSVQYTDTDLRVGFSAYGGVTITLDNFIVKSYHDSNPVVTVGNSNTDFTLEIDGVEADFNEVNEQGDLVFEVQPAQISSGGLGSVDVTFTNLDLQADTVVNGYTFEGPSISSIAPPQGSPLGGYEVTLSGDNFPLNNRLLGEKRITINNPGATISDAEVFVTVDTEDLITRGFLDASCGNLRTRLEGGLDINHWLEFGCNTSTTGIWLEVPSLGPGDSVVELYFAASGSSSLSDSSNFSFDSLINGATNKLWLKADEFAGQPDGTPISTWTDNSTSNLDATQVNANQRPVLENVSLNGLPSIKFDGVNDSLANFTAGPIPAGDDSYSIILVWSPEISQSAGIFDQTSSTLQSGQRAYLYQASTQYGFSIQGSQGTRFGPNNGDFGLTQLNTNENASNNTQNILNDNITTANFDNTTKNISDDQYGLGFNTINNNAYFNGRIAEVLVFDEDLSGSTTEIRAYLNQKYQIFGSEPNVTSIIENSEKLTIDVDGNSATNISIADENTITFTMPAGVLGVQTLTVTTPYGNQATTTFEYADPTISGISPNDGAAEGGYEVSIQGSSFVAQKYFQKVTLDNSANLDTLIDYQFRIELDTNELISDNLLSPDCSELYVVDTDKTTALPFWVEEESCNSSSTVVWTKLDQLDSGVTKDIYLALDPSIQNSLSNGDDVFLLFDNFEDGVLDQTKWQATYGSEADGYYGAIKNSAGTGFLGISSNDEFGDNTVLEARSEWSNNNNSYNTWFLYGDNPLAADNNPGYVIYFNSTSGNNFRGQSANGSSTNNIIESYVSGQTNRLQIKRTPTETIYAVNENEQSISSFVSSGLMNVGHGFYFSSNWNPTTAEYKVFSMHVRNYFENEPVITQENDFSGNLLITFDGEEVDSYEFISSGEYRVTVPTSILTGTNGVGDGFVDVVYTGPDSVSETAVNAFEYKLPVINSITPTAGPDQGGNDIVVKGNYLSKEGYKLPIQINNDTGNPITDYQTMIILDTQSLINEGKLGGDCGELHFTDDSGGLIDYYIEGICNSLYTIVWVSIPNLNAGSNTIYAKYNGYGLNKVPQTPSTFNFASLLTGQNNILWLSSADAEVDENGELESHQDRAKQKNVTIGTTSQIPNLESNSLQSYPALYFDGGDFVTIDYNEIVNSDYTIFLSAARTTSGSNLYILGADSSTPNKAIYLGYGTNTRLDYIDYSSFSLTSTISGYTTPENNIITARMDNNVGGELYYNGILQGTSANPSSLTQNFVGRLGSHSTNEFTGYINEVLIFDTALSTQDRQIIEDYLAIKTTPVTNIIIQPEQLITLSIDGLPIENFTFVDNETLIGRAPANTGIDKDVVYSSLLGNSASLNSSYDYGVDLAPNAVDDLSADVPASGIIELSWSEPNNNGQPVTDYTIEYATQSDFSDVVTYNDGVSTDTQITINDLNAITTYYFRIQAVNSIGSSSPSNVVEVTGQVCDVDYAGQDWIVSENTTISGVHCNIDEFRVEDTIILDITDQTAFEVYANDINVIGTIDGSGAGYQANSSANCEEFFGFGPGAGNSTGGVTSGGGGAHGGVGGQGSNITLQTGGETMYGIIEYPTEFGSGGAAGRSNCGSLGLGGYGGGAIKLNAPTITVAGELNVQGVEGVGGTTGYGNGFGAGGSIWIETTTLNGDGLITAQGGGNATDAGNVAGGAGGGGRVAIHYQTNNFTGVVSAEGGVMDSQPERNGGAGTLYWNNTSTGEEIIEVKTGNSDRTSTRIDTDLTDVTNVELQLTDASLDVNTPLTLANTSVNVGQDHSVYLVSGTTFTNVIDLDISGTLTLEDSNQKTFNDITINSGGLLTHSPNVDTIEHNLDIIANSVTIASGGEINVDGKGYTGTTEDGNGPGGGVEAVYVGPGGSYGGLGGIGGDFSAAGSGSITTPATPVYGSKHQPSELGSAGGASSTYNTVVGGEGGGLIKITTNIFDNLGIISANGLPGSTQANFGVGGAGSGGSIWIDADTINNVGTLRTNGADAESINSYAGLTYGANGGGGRIALYYEDRGTGIVTSNQGQEPLGTVAEDGTVYEDQIPESNLTSAAFDSIPDPVSVNATFDVRIKDILNVYGNPIRKGFVDDVACDVTILGDGGNYNETITGGYVEDGVCVLPSSFIAPTVTGAYTADITVTGSDTSQTQESKTAIPFTVVAQASNLAAAQVAPNDSKPQFTTLNPAAVQIIGETTSINITGLVDSGNGEALNGITCDFRITGPSSFDQTFTSAAAIGGECQYDFAQFELPPVAGTYAVEVIVQGDSGLLTTDQVNSDREFDINLNVADQVPGLNTSNKDPLIGDEENIITSPIIYKYDGVALIDEGLACEISLQDNTNTDIYVSTINSAGQCEVTVPVSTLTGSSVDIITQVTLPVNSVDYDFVTAATTIALVGSPSNLAKEDIGNPGQPVFSAITVSSDPAFLDQNVTLTVTGLLDSITDQPLEIATCNFAVTNPNTNSFVFNTTTASAGECTITVPGPDLLDGGQEVPGTYSFLLNISGDSGTLSTTSLNFDREYNIDLVGGLIPGSSTTTPTQVVVGQNYTVRSPRIYQFNGTTNILNGLPCENEVIVNGGAPQTVSGTTSSGYCTTSMPASGVTGNGTIVSRVTVAGTQFETASTPFEVKALNNAQICGLVFRDDTSDQSYDGGEVLLAGESIRLKDDSGATIDTKNSVDTGYVCFGSLFDGDYTLEILNGGPGGIQTLPTGGNNFFSITLAPGGTENRGFGFNGNAPVCPYPIFEDTDENGSQNGGEPSLVDIVTTLPLALYEASDLVTSIDTINANGSLCFADQAPGDYVVEMDIPADMSPTGSGFTINGSKVTKPVTVAFGLQGDVAFSFSFDPTGDPVEDPINPGQPINSGTVVNSSQIVYEGYNFDATTSGLLDTGNNQALEGLDGATCSMEFTGPSFPGGLIKSGVVTAGECYVDPVPDTPGPHGVTTTVDGPSGNPLTTIITTFDVVENNIDICPQPFRDYDLSGTKSANEPFIAGLSVDLVDNNTTNVIETITTDALGQNCFEEVDADDVDDYQVNITAPTNGVETTSTGLSVNIDPLPNQDENILFGFKGNVSICLENIYMDNNGNSTQDGLEAGLQGHQIVLNDEFNNNLPVVLSDSNGRGCVDELLDATYTMQVQDPVNNNKTISLTGVQQGTRTIVAVAGSGNGSNSNEYVESYGFQNDAEICPNPTFADYNKDGLFDNGEDEIGGLDTRLYLGTNNTGTLLETISTNGSLCFDPVPTADINGEFDFFIEQDVPTGGVLTTVGETYTFTQSFGIQVDKIFGYKGNATICPYPTFQDNNQNGVFDSEPTIDGVVTTLKDTSNTTIGTLNTNHTSNPCFTELLEGSYILSQVRPDNTVSTTGGTIQNVVTTAGNQEDIEFGYDGRPLICPVVYRDDDGNGIFDGNEFRFTQVDITLKNSGGTLLETIDSESTEKCFNTDFTEVGQTYIVESLAYPSYTITTSIANGSPNDNPDNTPALVFGQKYEPEFGYNGNGTICAQNVFEDFNANGSYDAGVDTFLPDGTEIVLTTLQGSTNYPSITITSGNACFTNIAPGQYTIDVEAADKPAGSISTTGGVQTLVLSPGETQNYNFGFTGDATLCPHVTFEDLDFDALYSPSTESQLSGLTVNIYRGADLINPYKSLTLSGSGTECFTGLFADNYRVEQVDLDTVFTGQYWNTTEATQSGTDPDDFYEDVTVASQDYLTVDFGYTQNSDFTLGAIFGFLYVDRAEDGTFDIAGADDFELTVFDNDVPVVDQTVKLFKFNTSSSLFEEVDATTSDENGNYEFTRLGVGDYEIRIPNTSLVGIKSVNPNPSTIPLTITNNATTGLNDKFYDQELSFQFTARICPFLYIDLNEDGNYDVGSDYPITENEGAVYGLSYTSFNGTQSAGSYTVSGSSSCIEELPPRDYTVTLTDPFGTAQNDGAFGPSNEYPINFYDQFDQQSFVRTVFLASEITDIETRIFSVVNIDRTPSIIEGRIWNNRPIYGSANPYETTFDADGGDDKTEAIDDAGNTSGYDYDWDNDFGYGGVTLELIKCYDGFQDPVPTTVWNANPPTTTTDADGFYRFDDTNVNFTDGMSGFYHLIPGDYAVIRQGSVPDEDGLTGIRAKQCEHIGIPDYQKQSIFFDNYPVGAPQAPNNRTSITPGTTVEQDEMMLYNGEVENVPFIDQSQNLLRDGLENACYLSSCPTVPSPASHVYGEFELRNQLTGDILAVQPFNIRSFQVTSIGYSGVGYGGLPGIIPGDYEIEMINIEPLDGLSQPHYTEIQPGELIKSHTQLNNQVTSYDYGFEPLFGTELAGYVFINRGAGGAIDLDGADDNPVTDFDNDEPLQGYTVEIKDSADNVVATETTDVNGFWSWVPGGQGLPEGAYSIEVLDAPPTGTNCLGCTNSTYISVLGGTPSDLDLYLTYGYVGYIGSDAFVDNDQDGLIEDTTGYTNINGREIAIRNNESMGSRTWDFQVYLYYEKGTPQEYLVTNDYTVPTCGIPAINPCVNLDNLLSSYFMNSTLKPGTYTLDLIINDPSLTLTGNSTGQLTQVINLAPLGKNWVRWAFNPRTNNTLTGNIFVDRGSLNETLELAGEDGLVGTGTDADSFDNELPLTGFTVKVHGPNGAIIESDAPTDANGNYTFTGIETGLYRLFDEDFNNPGSYIPFIETTDPIINTLQTRCITIYGCYGDGLGSSFSLFLSRGTVFETGSNLNNNMTYIYTNSISGYSILDLNGDGVISSYSNGTYDEIVGNQDYELEHDNTGKILDCSGENYTSLATGLSSASYNNDEVCYWQSLPAQWDGSPSTYTIRKLANLPNQDLITTRRISTIFGPSSNGLSLGAVDQASYTFNQFGVNQQQAFAFYQSQGVVTNNASITGFAFIDINNDGIFQPDGLDGDPQTIEDNETPLVDTSYILSGDATGSAAAGSLGQYQFTDLAAGNYTITSDIDPGTVSYSMRIIGATLVNDAMNGDFYRVTFSTQGFEPAVGGRHLRFYWDTEDTSATGQEVFSTGPYEVPIINRPAGANQICAVIMEDASTPIPNSGDCEPLP